MGHPTTRCHFQINHIVYKACSHGKQEECWAYREIYLDQDIKFSFVSTIDL